MNSLEASRVLAVLDEALEGIRLLSFVTTEVLDTADQLKDMLGEDLANTLVRHRDVAPLAKSNPGSEQVVASTLELCRLLKKSSTTHRLQSLHTERSPASLQVLSYFEKLRQLAQKRLTTTVEEDSSNREYYAEVREREEKAVADRVQLEQKLRLQRVELTKALNLVQAAEDSARAEIHDVQTSTNASMATLTKEAALVRKTDQDSYEHDYALLLKDLTDAKADLARLRAEARESELALRKARKRAQQDVEAVIGEYDADVGAKEGEFTRAKSEYDGVVKRLEELTQEYIEMLRERQDYEERERRLAEQRFQEALRLVRANRAARAIQAAYKAYKAAKEKARKKAKKEAAKKKKK